VIKFSEGLFVSSLKYRAQKPPKSPQLARTLRGQAQRSLFLRALGVEHEEPVDDLVLEGLVRLFLYLFTGDLAELFAA
jgi:hypothetical protein